MLNTQDAILDAIWNEDIEGFPDKFRDENLKEWFLRKKCVFQFCRTGFEHFWFDQVVKNEFSRD